MPINKAYGWKPSLPDIRDFKLSFEHAAQLPASVDLRTTGFAPDIWDQGQLGSCVSHGVDFAIGYDLAAQGTEKNWNGSRLYIYYNGRVAEGTVSEDSGLTITDGIKSINKYGSAPATDWAYDITRFTQKPPQKAYDDGAKHEAVKYAQVAQTSNDMKSCLAAGVPFVIGFTVYSSFESDATASNGVVTMPAKRESVLGGHCIAAVGYISGTDLTTYLKNEGLPTTGVVTGTTYYIMRNSWGTDWGDKGYCYMPEAYLTSTQLADDFWVVQTVSSPDPTPVPPQPTPTPTPTPTPGPVADATDKTFFTAFEPYREKHHVDPSLVSALKTYDVWAKAKKLK